MSWIEHIGITCKDIVESEAFYCKYFGAKRVKEMNVPARMSKKIFGIDSKMRILFLEMENKQIIELFYFPEAKDLGSSTTLNFGLTHCAIVVGDKEKFVEKLQGEGLDILVVKKDDEGQVYFTKDPDGVLIELRG